MWSCATCTGGEDFGNVVRGLRKSVGATDGQLFKQVVGAEFDLETVVVRISAVVAGTGNTQVAVFTANSRSDDCLSCRTRGNAGRDQVGSNCLQALNIRIAVDGLEQVLALVADIAQFDS